MLVRFCNIYMGDSWRSWYFLGSQAISMCVLYTANMILLDGHKQNTTQSHQTYASWSTSHCIVGPFPKQAQGWAYAELGLGDVEHLWINLSLCNDPAKPWIGRLVRGKCAKGNAKQHSQCTWIITFYFKKRLCLLSVWIFTMPIYLTSMSHVSVHSSTEVQLVLITWAYLS